jgi:hypothetical protein
MKIASTKNENPSSVKGRKRDAEADQRNVHRQRQRLHLARLEQVRLVHRRRAGLRQAREREGHHAL